MVDAINALELMGFNLWLQLGVHREDHQEEDQFIVAADVVHVEFCSWKTHRSPTSIVSAHAPVVAEVAAAPIKAFGGNAFIYISNTHIASIVMSMFRNPAT